MEYLRRLCQLAIKRALPPQQRGGIYPATPLGSAPNPELGREAASAPGPREKGADAPRERPEPGPRSGEAADAETAVPVPSSWTEEDRIPHWRGASRSPRRGGGEIPPRSTMVSLGQSLSMWKSPLTARIPVPTLARPQSCSPRGAPEGPRRPYLAGERRLRGAGENECAAWRARRSPELRACEPRPRQSRPAPSPGRSAPAHCRGRRAVLTALPPF